MNSICCEQLADPVRWLAHLATLTPEGQKACCRDDSDTPADHNHDDRVEQGQ